MIDEPLEGNVYLLTCFIVQGLRLLISLFGLVGNILSMIVWSRPHLKSPSSVVLIALAFSDSLFILSGEWFRILENYIFLKRYNGDPTFDLIILSYLNYYTQWTAVVSGTIYRMAGAASVHLTVIITVERYISICHPFWFNEWCSYSRTCKFVAFAMIFSVAYNIVHFWQYRVVEHVHLVQGKNITFNTAETVELFENPLYFKFHNTWVFLSIDFFLPLICIITLNTITYIQLKKINKEWRALTNSQRSENKLTTMVLYVVVEFAVCNSVSGLITVAAIFPDIILIKSFSQRHLISQVQAFLGSLNSSVNFVTYVSSWKPFRKTFIEIAHCHKKHDQPSLACPQGSNPRTTSH